jgi:hypothetical protein
VVPVAGDRPDDLAAARVEGATSVAALLDAAVDLVT